MVVYGAIVKRAYSPKLLYLFIKACLLTISQCLELAHGLNLISATRRYTIQDDFFGWSNIWQISLGKEISGFYIGDFVPRAIEHAQIKTKWWILYWQFLHRTANRQY